MPVKFSVTRGLYLGGAVALGTQILTWIGLGLTNWFVLLTYACVVVAVALACAALRREGGGRVRIGAALSAMVIMVLVGRLVFQLYMFVYVNHVEPGWIDTVAETWTASMVESGVAADVIVARIDSFRAAYTPLRMFTLELVGYAVPQLVLGTIVAGVYAFRSRRA